MRKQLVAALVALAFVAPAPARALVFLGARAGYSIPSGDVQKGAKLGDVVKHDIPIQVDAGLGLLPFLTVGLYGSWGPSTMKDSGVDGSQLRAGLQLNFRPPVMSSLWAGVFGGYEQQSVKAGSLDGKLSGWEAGLQAGYDLSLLAFKLGPYASYSMAQFGSASGGLSLGDKSGHQYFTIGLRAAFDL